ncbi:unnamed protein product [Sympodiomycopsis kandeliae]
MSSSDSISPPLSQGWGYGVTVGFGLAFALGMHYVTRLLKKHTGEDNAHFETYATAGRNVGIGLTCTAVISSWAWSTALLSSSVVANSYGVAGPYAFAAGCLVQISGFAVLAIQSKLKAPHAHTSLELIKVRYGTTAHWIYMFLCLANNLIAVVNMFLGSSATIAALTGMHTVAAIFLLPLGVCLYTISGGLRATFITDYLHTVALLIIAVFLTVKTITHPAIGSPRQLFDLVNAAAVSSPAAGNQDGSYFTMASKGGLEFLVLHTLGNFGLVIMDSSYWQKAFSADISAAVPAYLAGGVLYFGIPWALGTVMGLASIGLQSNPIWPAFGRALTKTEVNGGLPLAYTALAVAGKGGAVAVVILIFMAVTSTCSAQIIAVSSIVSSDMYHTYIRPDAKDKAVIRVSRLACVGFALVGSAVSVAFYYANLDLTWTLYFLGIVTTPGMITLPLTILWSKQTRLAAIVSPLVGMAVGLVVWLVTASHYGNGELSVATTGALLPCLWGTIAASFVPPILTVIISYAKPDEQPWDWSGFDKIKLVHHDDDSASTLVDEKKHINGGQTISEHNLEQEDHAQRAISPEKVRYMQRASNFAAIWGIVLFLIVWILVPFAIGGSRYIFNWRFFTGWVVVAILWLFITLLLVVFLPPIEGRSLIFKVIDGVRGKVAAVTGNSNSNTNKQADVDNVTVVGHHQSDSGSGSSSPNEEKSKILSQAQVVTSRSKLSKPITIEIA